MSPVRTAEHQRVKDIVAVRKELDDRVGSKADILGSMVGIKMRRGKLTGTIGMTYFVKAKVPKAELSPHRRVPGRLKSGDLWVGTDVIEWPRMVKQSGADPLIISDSIMQGTLGCFGASDAGVFGISAAHCLLGADGNPSTPTEVAYFGAQQQQWITAGESIALGYSPGLGIPGNYGSLDCVLALPLD